MDRASIVNSIIGKPYRLGAQGPDEFDCYSTARFIQAQIFGRPMPAFEMPAEAGRYAMAAAIAVHPERGRWLEISKPIDGALVTMARNHIGYHVGVWLDDDGGLIIHALEGTGVIADTLPALETVGWRSVRFHVPEVGP